MRSSLMLAVLASTVALTTAAKAQDNRPNPCPTESPAITNPTTQAEFLNLVERYDAKAAADRQEASEHRRMIEEARQRTAELRGHENPAVTKMREHCKVYIDRAEKLAAAAERLADYYRLRAEELK